LPLTPEAAYALLTDVDKYPSWRPGVKSVTRQPDHDGKPAWTEAVSGDRIPLRFEQMERPSILVARIADPSLPFGGTWTYRIAPEGSGSTVSITEDGEVYNPIFRFMSRFVFGHDATLEAFTRDLLARAR
jgi:ribosome-associated toxin RatA of RatAB toxin-antitoxin module